MLILILLVCQYILWSATLCWTIFWASLEFLTNFCQILWQWSNSLVDHTISGSPFLSLLLFQAHTISGSSCDLSATAWSPATGPPSGLAVPEKHISLKWWVWWEKHTLLSDQEIGRRASPGKEQAISKSILVPHVLPGRHLCNGFLQSSGKFSLSHPLSLR